jgi:ligand-binding sensor domain-containing protein/signal transduction histidine kinase
MVVLGWRNANVPIRPTGFLAPGARLTAILVHRSCVRDLAASFRRTCQILAALALLSLPGLGAPVVLSYAQVGREFDRKSWHVEDGLPDERVMALLQSRDGYLWIGTQSGIARFDGREFTVYNRANTPQLDSDDCDAIVQDSDGNLWFGFRFGRVLVRKTGEQFKAFGPPPGPHTSVDFDRCKLVPSRRGGIWCSDSRMLYRFQGDRFQTYQLPYSACSDPIPICEQEDGTLVLGSWVRCSLFDPRNESFAILPLSAGSQASSAIAMCTGSGGDTWILSVDSASSTLPISSRGHVVRLKESLSTGRLDAPDEGVEVLARTIFLTRGPDNALWMPDDGHGIVRYTANQYQVLPMRASAEKESATGAITDREGNLWIGSDNNGLQRWIPRKVTTLGVQDGLPHSNTWSILQARDGTMWIGTQAGVCHLDHAHVTNYQLGHEAPANAVRSIVQDRTGAIWVGTIRLLASIRDGVLSERRFPGPWEETKIRCLLASRDGALWVGAARGLSRMVNGVATKFTEPDGPGNRDVRALLEGRDGGIWIGTAGGGLFRFHQGEFSVLTVTNGLSNQNVWALYQDSEGGLWIGTDSGLNLLKNGRLTAFTTRQGLPANQVDSLLEDDFGRLWVSHDRGLYWVNKSQFAEVIAGTRQSVSAVAYDQTDGLPTLDFNGQKSNPTACKARDGRLWFPTEKGVVVLDPSKVSFDATPPLTVIEQVRANGKLLLDRAKPGASIPAANAGFSAGGGLLKLPPGGAKVVEFRYNAPTFLAPEKVRFRFRLLGLSQEWLQADERREAYFTDLRPGDYTFEVVACNHHGIWQEHGATFAFSVAEHFYQSSLFYTASGLGMLSMILGVSGWRLREIRKIHRLERHKAVADERERFAQDVHDELGASLNQILSLSQVAAEGSGQPDTIARRLQHIRMVARSTLSNIGQVVWANNPKFDTLFDLVGYLREFCAEYFEHTHIRVQFDFPEEVPAMNVPGVFRRQLLLIVKEAMQNVVKHANATQVRVGLALVNGRLEVSILDDGCGFASGNPSHKEGGIGNMNNRVDRLGGTLTIKPQVAQGTLVRISVPLPRGEGE